MTKGKRNKLTGQIGEHLARFEDNWILLETKYDMAGNDPDDLGVIPSPK